MTVSVGLLARHSGTGNVHVVALMCFELAQKIALRCRETNQVVFGVLLKQIAHAGCASSLDSIVIVLRVSSERQPPTDSRPKVYRNVVIHLARTLCCQSGNQILVSIFINCRRFWSALSGPSGYDM